jgi:hypothetical protein
VNDVEILREAATRLRIAATPGNPNPYARPDVDAALADWLDAEANVHELCAAADVAIRVHTGNEFGVNTLESTLPQAVAVARAVLSDEQP